jgi:hypothetical protein
MSLTSINYLDKIGIGSIPYLMNSKVIDNQFSATLRLTVTVLKAELQFKSNDFNLMHFILFGMWMKYKFTFFVLNKWA